jgi:hypothetical protein
VDSYRPITVATLEEIFEKIFKNPLTKGTECAIISM